jgi:hypothetical protein
MSTVTDHPAVPPEAAAAQLVFQFATGHIMASALRSALVFGIPERLTSGPRDIASLAKDAGANEDALYRVLRVLAAFGVFAEPSPRVFEMNLASRMLLKDTPGSLAGLVRWICDAMPMRAHAEMEYSVRTGQPAAEQVYGMPVFEYFSKNPVISEIFNQGMTSFSAAIIPAVLDAYDFAGIGTLVDIAGGHGAVLTAILKKYPAMSGVLFDLDHVIAGARANIEAQGLSGRCRAESGDFFKDVPAADAYVMKHIIHDWDDERAVKILQNARRRLTDPATGRILLLEAVIQSGPGPDLGKVIDLEMLVMPGGKERTADEFASLFAAAGLRLSRIVPTASPLSVIEARVA